MDHEDRMLKFLQGEPRGEGSVLIASIIFHCHKTGNTSGLWVKQA